MDTARARGGSSRSLRAATQRTRPGDVAGARLTIAGQAFLLPVLADETLDCRARAVVLLAGLLAAFAAAVAIWHLRKREVEYSKRIEGLAARIEIEDPKPQQFAWPFPIITGG